MRVKVCQDDCAYTHYDSNRMSLAVPLLAVESFDPSCSLLALRFCCIIYIMYAHCIVHSRLYA